MGLGPEYDCVHNFPFVLDRNRYPFSVKTKGKQAAQSEFGRTGKLFPSVQKCVVVHTQKQISDHAQIERNAIVVTVFLLIIDQTKFRLAHNQKENCHNDQIPINF